MTAQELTHRDPNLDSNGLQGGFEFSDGQMDDYALGMRVADQAKKSGVEIAEHTEVKVITSAGQVTVTSGDTHKYDRLINIAGPWAHQLMRQSEIETPFQLDLVRCSHIVLQHSCQQAYLLEAPIDRHLFFVFPWQGNTLVGTTEERQGLDEPIACSREEQDYLVDAWSHYFSNTQPKIHEVFAGLRALLRSAQDPNKASREYAIHHSENLITVFTGKWATALALAEKVPHIIH